MAQAAVIRKLISGFVERRPMRTTSLIVTIFGDVVFQHGGTLWLGSLVRALALLGINERLVRTSVFRLVQEGWLEFDRQGRRSYYRFTEYGAHEYERAARRIYALDENTWDGSWQILIPQGIPEKERERFRRSLYWQGFRNINTGTYVKPGSRRKALLETLEEFNATDKVLLMQADTDAVSSQELIGQIMRDNWNLDELAAGYRQFLQRFKPLLAWLQRRGEPDPETAFIARTLLIHDYRRILLQDTEIPEELLPAGWPGRKALQLTGRIYRILAPVSECYICERLESGADALPPADEDFRLRFARVAL